MSEINKKHTNDHTHVPAGQTHMPAEGTGVEKKQKTTRERQFTQKKLAFILNHECVNVCLEHKNDKKCATVIIYDVYFLL